MFPRIFLIFIGLTLMLSCQPEPLDLAPIVYPKLMDIPVGFPMMESPDGNEFTQARWELGKKLFYDKALSVDQSISCASCHLPAHAFSDNVAVSLGVEDRPGNRNSPSLANVGYHPYFLREGGVPTLEMQVLVPIQEHVEFDFNMVLLAERLSKDPNYVSMAQNAYDRTIDPYTITRALACFERSLISGNSRYDQFFYQEMTDVLTDEEQEGRELFFSEKTNCSNCHGGFNFTNYAFENNGIYKEYTDPGRSRVTGAVADFAKFKVPTLRNVEHTGPYMHDGSMETLEEIIDHYDAGGRNNPEQSTLIRPLNLTTKEKSNLLAFLKTLSDDTFINNPIFQK